MIRVRLPFTSSKPNKSRAARPGSPANRSGGTTLGKAGSAGKNPRGYMDHEKWLEQHNQMIADHELRFSRDMALLQGSQAKTEQTLRRAIRLAVQDARRQRRRNVEFDEKMRQIASAHEQLVKALMERGGNGKH